MKTPVSLRRAEQAFEAHKALVLLEKANPSLARNEFFKALRDTAYARMRMMQEVCK